MSLVIKRVKLVQLRGRIIRMLQGVHHDVLQDRGGADAGDGPRHARVHVQHPDRPLHQLVLEWHFCVVTFYSVSF